MYELLILPIHLGISRRLSQRNLYFLYRYLIDEVRRCIVKKSFDKSNELSSMFLGH